jgi:serine/threonine protein kinase
MVPLQPLALRHEIGDVIKDRYSIRDVLGAGAFGTVYRVEETLGSRTVSLACKEMHVLDDPDTQLNERSDALRMFQEEAYLLQTLRHPNIPAAHFESVKAVWLACPICGRTFRGERNCPDHGAALQVVNERYYLLMDFLEGPDLENLLTRSGRPLSESDVIDWTLQVCNALEAVHAKGFSHRDIKPANIKIQKSGDADGLGQAMLIDFGLVKPSMTAGRYGTVLKRTSTAMGTLGYAPVSHDEQNNPDARTDILALGMTMYRVLTFRDPTEPAELEQMRAKKPREFNSALSPMIEEIILKAIQIDREKRYVNVAALRSDLLAARYPVETTCPYCSHVQRSLQRPDENTRCERCGRPLASAPVTMTAPPVPPTSKPGRAATLTPPRKIHLPNPHEPRIRQIEQQLQSQPPTPPSRFDARISEIEGILARTSRFTVGPHSECPSCRQSTLKTVSGQPTGRCPLCAAAQLVRRQLEFGTCAVCREGELHYQEIRSNQLFCPVCRAVPLQSEERRAMLGLAVDEWWRCPNCETQWDVTNKGTAILEKVGEDPFGVGETLNGRNLPIGKWREVSQRGQQYFECDNCHAQWDVDGEDALRLAYYANDPFGVGQQRLGSTLTQQEWARVAQNLPSDAGTHHCPECASEWNYDRDRQTMTLLREGRVLPDWAAKWRGMPVSLPAWYFAQEGKRSFSPGKVCPNCHSEWNDYNSLWKLAGSDNDAFKPHIGESLPGEDWRRIGFGLPTVQETTQLRSELKRLQESRAQEQLQAQKSVQRQFASLEEERLELYKQSVLEGFIPLQRMSPAASADDWKHVPGTFVVLPLSVVHVALRPGEDLRWESPAVRCGVQSDGQKLLLRREYSGTLMVSNERIQFVNSLDNRPNQVWQQQVKDLRKAEIVPVDKSVVVILDFYGTTSLIGFEVAPLTWSLKTNGHLINIAMKPYDLLKLLNSLR